MADVGDLDAGHHSVGESSQNVRKNIALHLKTSTATKSRRGRKPGRPKKDERPPQQEPEEGEEEVQLPPMKGPPEPLHRKAPLMWDHKVNLVGRRHMDPHIHCCEQCKIPILIYGRVIPCKHVFCLDCAKKAEKTCMRCGDPVQRIEQAALGTVFICTHGGTKHGVAGCRRTYLSNRDLQAHIQYRHAKDEARMPARSAPTTVATRTDYITQPVTTVAMVSQGVQQTLLQQPQQIAVGQSYATAAGDGLHVLAPQSFSAPPPGVVPQQHAYTQPPQQAVTMESYHTSLGVMNQATAVPGTAPHGHPSNLISIPIQQEQLAGVAGAQQGAYDARVPPPQLAQPPPGVTYVQQTAPGGVAQPRGYPPVSFQSTSMPPPHHNAPPMAVHMPPRNVLPPNSAAHPGLVPPRGGVPQNVTSHAVMPPRGGPAIVTSHAGIAPRGAAPPRFQSNQPNFAQQGGHWQGQGQPPIGHRPRTSAGAPPRY